MRYIKLFLVTLLLFFVAMPMTASAAEFAFDDLSGFDFCDLPYKVIFHEVKYHRYVFYASDKPLQIKGTTFANFDDDKNQIDSHKCHYYLDDKQTVWTSSVFARHNHTFGVSGVSCPETSADVLVSNFDIYKTDGTLFFQATPKPPAIWELATAEMLGMVMTEIKILIPIVMIIVVSLAAFWKCWKWLRTVLSRL